jgi:hypothetical protein
MTTPPRRRPDAIDAFEGEVSRALGEASSLELQYALAEEHLPETAHHVFRDGSVRLIDLGESRAHMTIDRRFAEVLTEINEQARKIARLERDVAAFRASQGDGG